MQNQQSGYIYGKSHAEGGIPVVVAPTNHLIEVEGKEYQLCREAVKSPKEYHFVEKTNRQILDEIFQSSECLYTKGRANAGDFIVCKLATNDPTKRTISGTAKQILNILQFEHGCKVENMDDNLLYGGLIQSDFNPDEVYSLVQQGSDINKIADETGFIYSELSGTWEKEIYDAEFKVIYSDDQIYKLYKTKNFVPLFNFIKHPKFFAQFPEYRRIPVYINEATDSREIAFIRFDKNDIQNYLKYEIIININPKRYEQYRELGFARPESAEAWRSLEYATIHELQHVLQFRQGLEPSESFDAIFEEISKTYSSLEAYTDMMLNEAVDVSDRADIIYESNLYNSQDPRLIAEKIYSGQLQEIEAKKVADRYLYLVKRKMKMGGSISDSEKAHNVKKYNAEKELRAKGYHFDWLTYAIRYDFDPSKFQLAETGDYYELYTRPIGKTGVRRIIKVDDRYYYLTSDSRFEDGGEIPDRYKELGFTSVGQKKESTRPEKKWMVLAKKGDQYKVVHGGFKGMEDFSEHKDKERQKRFWDRMGGYDSKKTKDTFSPLYWHKKFGTWENGGILPDDTIKVVWVNTETPETMESKMFEDVDSAKKYAEGTNDKYLIMELDEQDGGYYKWTLLPFGEYKNYKTTLNINHFLKFKDGGKVYSHEEIEKKLMQQQFGHE